MARFPAVRPSAERVGLVSNYPEPDAGLASAWTRIGGALVDRDEILSAIGALSGLQDSDTIIIKSLKGVGSPLADTDYRWLADQYLREHSEESQADAAGLKHPPRRRLAFIRMLQHHLRKLDELAAAAPAGPPPDAIALDDVDARTRVTREVVSRQGQAQFRNMLIKAYEGRCAITGCDIPYALEAAHIRPYRGEHTNVVTNGLLLRADIHTLFDLALLAVNPVTLTVVLSDQIAGDHYTPLKDRPLKPPADPQSHPDSALLAERWEWFYTMQTSTPPPGLPG
jgi:hypothetical protein